MDLIAELSASVVRALDAGDIAAARVANDAVTRLLGEATVAAGAEVIDLAERRPKSPR